MNKKKESDWTVAMIIGPVILIMIAMTAISIVTCEKPPSLQSQGATK